jgi:UDP-N-acetylmuramate dehydrogenase
MELKQDFSLQELNSFGLDVRTRYFLEISSVEGAKEYFKNQHRRKEKTLILGGGSNLLFSENRYNGIVIKNSIGGIHVVKKDDHFFWVKAGAGVLWHALVESCINANFGGIENLSLIPGTVGAAPIQNIGAYGAELKDVFEALEAIEISTGEKKYFKKEACQFGYRDSIFKHELRNKFFITHVVLRLSGNPTLNISYGKVQEYLKKLNKSEYTIKDVSDVIINIRQSKLPDPDVTGNAGSFFKNPVISQELLNAVKISYPDIPYFDQADSQKKIPAAWLIDQCQLKGYQHGGASVHVNQPLVLINNRLATGKDIIELSKKVQEKVFNRFGIQLEPEVSIV